MRRRNRRRPDWIQTLLATLLFVLAAECVWAAFTSPRLAVRHIEVVGAKDLSTREIADMTGIAPGSNLFRANLYRARRAVRAVPAVKDANVSRLLPDTIAVTLTEREPRFSLAVGTRLFAVDREGVVFREIPPAPTKTEAADRPAPETMGPHLSAVGEARSARAAVSQFAARSGEGKKVRPFSLPGAASREPRAASASGASPTPVLRIANRSAVRLGQTLDGSVIKATLHCMRLARADGLKLWKMSIDAHGDLWLNIEVPGPTRETGTSWTIRMGRPQELGVKFADARQIMKGAPRLAAVVKHLDVSCPRRPAYRVAAQMRGPTVP